MSADGERPGEPPASAGGQGPTGVHLSWEAEDPSADPSEARVLAQEAEIERAAPPAAPTSGASAALEPRRRLLARHRYPRLRLALLCVIGLASGGLAGASLGALHFLLFEPAPALPEPHKPEAAPGAAERATAAAKEGNSGPGRARGTEVLDALPLPEPALADAGPAPAVQAALGGAGQPTEAQAGAASGGRLIAGGAVAFAPSPDSDAAPEAVANVTSLLPAGQPMVVGAAPPPRPEPAHAARPALALQPSAKPQALGPAPAKPEPDADPPVAGLLPPPAAPREDRPMLAQAAADKVGPQDWGELYRRARTLQEEDRLEAAIEAYRRAAAADPSHAATFYDLGYALQQAGRSEPAMAAYRRSLELDPDHAYAHYNLGYLLQQRGKFGDAIANYRAAAALDRDNPYIFYNWGEILDRQGDARGAADLYRRASRLASDRQPGPDARARLDRLQGEREPG